MSATDDMPESVQEAPQLRPPRAERQSREARASYWRAFMISAFFVAVLAANLFVGAVVVAGRVQSQASVPGASGPTALITRPMLDGTFCRYSVFDNTSAHTIEDKIELCDSRKTNSKSDFSWGGR